MPKMKIKKIYFDYAATTPVDKMVFEAMLPYLKEEYGNPSSIHFSGEEARQAIDKARDSVADFLGCSQEEIIFTGSATEANNLAIKGLILKLKNQNLNFRPHIITTEIEHHAVLEPCKELEKRGIEVTYLPVDKRGLISLTDFKKAIKKNTVLVSIMYANNEIGAIQPVTKIGRLIKRINSTKRKYKILFHTDAVQAVNYLDCNIKRLGVDLLTLSSHKIYGPKGVGALYVKKGLSLAPLIEGGGHEFGLRSGTENVAGIVGLGAAIEEVKKQKKKNLTDSKNNASIEELRNRLIDGIINGIPESRLNSSKEKCLPNIANFSFKGIEGEAAVLALSQKGICVSTGSACSSKSLEPSHVLLAIGLKEAQAHSSLRFSLGKYTTKSEIKYVLEILPQIIEKLRKISGYH